MKICALFLLLGLPVLAQEIIIKPVEGKGEGIRVDVSGPTKIVLDGKAYLIEPAEKTATQLKAESINLPSLNFENTTAEDSIEFLRMRSFELDAMAEPEYVRGINFVMQGRFPKPVDELRLRNVSIHEALRQIAIKLEATVEYRANLVTIIGKK